MVPATKSTTKLPPLTGITDRASKEIGIKSLTRESTRTKKWWLPNDTQTSSERRLLEPPLRQQQQQQRVQAVVETARYLSNTEFARVETIPAVERKLVPSDERQQAVTKQTTQPAKMNLNVTFSDQIGFTNDKNLRTWLIFFVVVFFLTKLFLIIWIFKKK